MSYFTLDKVIYQ